MTFPSGSMLYTQGQGSRPENVEIPIVTNRSPGPSDKKYPIGKRWINNVLQQEYCLTSFSYSGSTLIPTWTLLSSSATQIVSAGLTPNMVAGVVTVIDGACTDTSIITFSAAYLSPNHGNVSVAPETGNFYLTSSNSNDTSSFYYIILSP
jgi:hypothetical protein